MSNISDIVVSPITTTPIQVGAEAGAPGPRGKSAYQSWLDAGNTGTEADFVAATDAVAARSGAVSDIRGTAPARFNDLGKVADALTAWQTISSATTAQAGDRLQCDTSGGAFTLTLPASAPEGTIVWIADPMGTWAANPLTVAGNGRTFEDGPASLVLSVASAEVHLVVQAGKWTRKIVSTLGTDGKVPVAELPVFTIANNTGRYPFAAFRQAGNDDTSTLQRVFQEAGEDELVDFDPAVTYTIAGGVVAQDRAVRLNGRGAKIRRPGEGGSNLPLLDIRFAFRGVASVSVVDTTTVDFGGGAVRVSRLTASSSLVALATVGDAIKIVSDDAIPSSPASDNEKRGEIAFVVAKDGTAGTITLDRVLRETFLTNIRAALLTNKPVLVESLEGYDQQGSRYRSQPLIRIVGAVTPLVRRASLRDLSSPGIQLESCIGAVSEDCRFNDLRTIAATNQYGYGIVEYGCVDGVHKGIVARRVRHAYTTGSRGAVAANSDIALYGGTIGSQIIGADAQGCFGAALDTHSDALGIVFSGGMARGTNPGDDTSAFPIQLRGRKCVVDGVQTVGASCLKVISNAVAAGADGGHRVRVVHQRPSGYQTVNPIFQLLGNATYPGCEIDLTAKVDAEDGTFPLLRAEYCRVTGELALRHKQSDQGATPHVVVDAVAATVRMALRADWSGSSGALIPRLAKGDATSIIDIEKAVVRPGAAGWYIGDGGNVASVIRAHDVDASAAPSGLTGFVNTSNTSFWSRAGVDGVKVQDASAARSDANATMTPINGGLQTLSVPLTADRTITLTTSGFAPGSAFEFVRTASSTGAFNWNIGALAALAPGQWARVKLAGGWQLVAKGTL